MSPPATAMPRSPPRAEQLPVSFQLAALANELDLGRDGLLVVPGEYLEVVVTKA